MNLEITATLIRFIGLVLILYAIYKVARHINNNITNIMAAVVLFLAITICCVLFAVIYGPVLFSLAHDVGFINDKISDSDSISYFLSSFLAVAIGAMAYTEANLKLK